MMNRDIQYIPYEILANLSFWLMLLYASGVKQASTMEYGVTCSMQNR